ncbi:MAG: zinc-binding dehydrogenase [Halanaerobium sp.]
MDYTKDDFSQVLKDFDLAIDTLGGDVQDKSFDVLEKNGKLVSIVEEPAQKRAAHFGVEAEFHWLIPDGEELAVLAKMMEEEKLKPVVGTAFFRLIIELF